MSRQVPDARQPPTETDEPRAEEDSFGRGSIEERLEASEFRRSERLRDALNDGIVYVALVAPYFLAVIGAVLMVVMLWHYIGREEWAWMTPQQVDKVEAAFGGGILSALFIMLRDYVGRRR